MAKHHVEHHAGHDVVHHHHYRRGGHVPEEDCEPHADGGKVKKKRVEGEGRKARHRMDRAHGGRAKTTPSGGVSADYRHNAEKHGHTMAGGSFPIEDAEDLAKAKHDIGRAKNPAAARAWINKRAKQMGEPGVGED